MKSYFDIPTAQMSIFILGVSFEGTFSLGVTLKKHRRKFKTDKITYLKSSCRTTDNATKNKPSV